MLVLHYSRFSAHDSKQEGEDLSDADGQRKLCIGVEFLRAYDDGMCCEPFQWSKCLHLLVILDFHSCRDVFPGLSLHARV